MYGLLGGVGTQCNTGFSLTPYLEYFTPIFGLETPVFQGISSILHCRTPTFSQKCLWGSYFQNPSENPGNILDQILYGTVLSLIEKAVLLCVKLYWSLINCSLPPKFLKYVYDIEKVLLS